MNTNNENAIECPFFIEKTDTSITCEGIIDNTVSVHRFKNKVDFNSQEKNFCCVYGGRHCPHYRNVMVLYDRGLR